MLRGRDENLPSTPEPDPDNAGAGSEVITLWGLAIMRVFFYFWEEG